MYKFDYFQSTTYGQCDLPSLRKHVLNYLKKEPDRSYKLVIGSDSQPKNGSETDFVVAIIIHRVGAGGIYFWNRNVEKKQYALKARMYQEAAYSLSAAEKFLAAFKNDGISKYDVEIHVDIGKVGETREVINEIVGMIRGSGYLVRTKPDSYGASKVADRHT